MSDAADQAASDASDRVLAKWGEDYRRDGVAETLGMLHDTPMGDPCDAIRLLRWLHAEAEWKRERLSILLRGMARQATARGRLADSYADTVREANRQRDAADEAVRIWVGRLNDARAELARLRERAVVLPPDARNHVERTIAKHTGWVTGETANMARDLLALIESWRPSTGDTDGTADDCGSCYRCLEPTFPEVCGVRCQNVFIVCVTCGNKRCPHATDHVLVCTGSNAGNQPGSRYQYAETTALPEGTPAETTYRSSGTVQRGLHAEECDGSSDCQALGHIDGCFAAPPEGNPEPEPAWGVDRPVHGHTGDQT